MILDIPSGDQTISNIVIMQYQWNWLDRQVTPKKDRHVKSDSKQIGELNFCYLFESSDSHPEGDKIWDVQTR